MAAAAPAAAAPRSRAWCWTAYAPNLAEDWLFTLAPEYWCYGEEVCPVSKKEHWQGYLELKNAKTMSALKKKIPQQIHLEIRRGTQDQAIDYCKKDGAFHEFGLKASQGQRVDLENIRKQILEGTEVRDIADRHFAMWCQYRKAFAEYAALHSVPRTWETEVHIIWGATGTGKTRHAIDAGAAMVEMDKGGFMHGYAGQPILLFDDFDVTTISRSLFLRLTDRYPTTINVKGGSMNWNPKTIYITSNFSPAEWYDSCPAVQRRFTTITQMAQLFAGPRPYSAIPALLLHPVALAGAIAAHAPAGLPSDDDEDSDTLSQESHYGRVERLAAEPLN